ncbi:class I SAM-dependent DNA methyltransferase [Spirosoma fluviale]|uniref:Methyltransferase domain-containing protein n=1 Tax=Spirosoma fluviale TaxID=1597977 RepID=A0A286F4B5_9BACT|nr:class I SAM-dependent methyltransferase [Spirosoma fluviale]SOD78055.1 Methyltransferase domain-containing protein [Spirosoma fluviale]
MIGRSEEYEKMFRLEGQLWWYRHLHERVADALLRQFGKKRDMSILDAGCGTGGLLLFLRQMGYTRLRGIDGSTDAVACCHDRELPVSFVNLNDLADFEPTVTYDVIVCNDVFCYFLDADLLPLIAALANRLKPGGILISNNNAFRAFRGEHDLAVGIVRRFVLSDFERLLPPCGLKRQSSTYWSFVLSLPIVLVRQWQQLQLKLGWHTPAEAMSDVYLPSPWLNKMLLGIVRAEQKLLTRTPFGSSLFMVCGK